MAVFIGRILNDLTLNRSSWERPKGTAAIFAAVPLVCINQYINT